MTASGSLPTPARRAAGAPPPFRSILCGIDGGRADALIARQAALLAGREARLELVAVTWEIGTGMSAQATLTRAHANNALEHAMTVARDAGALPTSRVAEGPDAAAVLVAESADRDLLVLGVSGARRLAGIVTGRPGTAAVHRADCAVLLTRRAPEGHPFPQRVLLADDGEASSDEAARIAAALAGQFGGHVIIAAPMAISADQRNRIARHGEEIMAAGAPEPVLADVRGHAHDAIPKLARENGASVVVIGSRRLHGARALVSVSERVAHDAPCSVIVARGG
jgi:nucleotide-binding universal stress UspA family protein